MPLCTWSPAQKNTVGSKEGWSGTVSTCGNEKYLQTISRLDVRSQAEQAGWEAPLSQPLRKKLLLGRSDWGQTLALQRYGEIPSPCRDPPTTPCSSVLDLCKFEFAIEHGWGELCISPESTVYIISQFFDFSLNILLGKIQKTEWSGRDEIPHN